MPITACHAMPCYALPLVLVLVLVKPRKWHSTLCHQTLHVVYGTGGLVVAFAGLHNYRYKPC